MPKGGRAKFISNKRDRSEDEDDYVSDDGFVADGVKEKKSKTKKARVKAEGSNDNDEKQMWEVTFPIFHTT